MFKIDPQQQNSEHDMICCCTDVTGAVEMYIITCVPYKVFTDMLLDII